jgi:uncharacterized protein YgfB (UPF0149 family)
MTNASALPDYAPLAASLTPLDLPFSLSQLHGLLCGYVCAANQDRASAFLHTLTSNQKHPVSQETKTQLFALLTFSEHQIQQFEFEFQFLLPDEHTPLINRAQAFSEWCDGFLQGLHACHIQDKSFKETETKEALIHFQEFSQLDTDNLSVSEEDEKAFMEVYEYARLAVLSIRAACESLHPNGKAGQAKH